MKKGFVIFLMAILLVGLVVAASGIEENKKIDKEILKELKNNEKVSVIIDYKESSSSMRLFSTKSQIKRIKESKAKSIFTSSSSFSAELTMLEIEELLKDSLIEKISYNYPIKILMSDSVEITEANNTWVSQINGINITGANQTICIIDTGINYSHIDFGGCTNSTFASGNCEKVIGGYDFGERDADPMDYNGHGSHVAGIAAGNGITTGIAKDAKIVAMKVFDDAGSGAGSLMVEAIDACVDNASIYNISLITISLGLVDVNGTDILSDTYCDDYFPSFTAAINAAVAKNISVTVATGNNGNSSFIGFPSCIENVTRIGATTKTPGEVISPFTNRGLGFLDILLAPGSNIISTDSTGTSTSKDGTSMATPMVAGAIALLKQYKRLESNRDLTSDELKLELKQNGEQINDTSGTNQNFSRINIYSTLLAIDIQAPNITSMLPINSSALSQNQSFSCNATDLQLSNLTIKIYNSTVLVANETTTSNSLTLYHDTIDDEYNWSCEAVDDNSNSIIKTNTLSVSSLFVNINSTNNNYTNQNETSFNCSTTTSKELSNITFSIYNSTDLLNSTPTNLTGASNYSIFNYNLTNEGEYYYNCLATNNDSQTASTGNYTIIYDITPPQITLLLPVNATTVPSPINFTYEETETNKDSCNLTINNTNYPTFIQEIPDGNYNWSVTCTDLANNTNTSETRILTIYTAPAPVVSSGGGGGSSSPNPSAPTTYTATEPQIKTGYIQKLKVKEIINFEVKSSSHKLTLNKINTDKVEIIIESTPINVTLYINSTQKINLDNDETFDLEITLLSIIDDYADIKIKEINETVPVKQIMPELNDTQITLYENKTKPEESKETPKKNNYIIIILIIIFLLIAILIKIKIINKQKEKNRKDDNKLNKLNKIKSSFKKV